MKLRAGDQISIFSKGMKVFRGRAVIESIVDRTRTIYLKDPAPTVRRGDVMILNYREKRKKK